MRRCRGFHAFRDEREASGVRLRDARRELAEEGESLEPSNLTAQGSVAIAVRNFRVRPLSSGEAQAGGPAK